MARGRPPSRGPPADAANSSNARGLPCASSATRRRTRVGRWTNWRASRPIASACESGATSYSGNPARSKNPPTSGRMAPSSPIRLPRSRRPTNPTAAPLARSSQCKSSMTMSSGPRDAAWRNSASDAFSTARRSGAGPEPRPSATSSASRLERGRRGRSPDSGPTSWCRPAKLTSVSYSTPPPRITSNPAVAAISAAAASNAVLPTPGSPVSRSVVPSAPASSRSDPRAASSRSRPIRRLVQTLTSSTVAVLPHGGSPARSSDRCYAPGSPRSWAGTSINRAEPGHVSAVCAQCVDRVEIDDLRRLMARAGR